MWDLFHRGSKLYIVALFIGAALLIALSRGWTWGPTDEITWLYLYDHGWTTLQYIQNDLAESGRFRPVIPFLNFCRVALWHEHPQLLRLEQLAWFAALIGIFAAWLRSRRVSPLATLLAIAFVLKSPPAFDMIHIFSASELPGLLFFFSSLLLRRISRPLSWIFLLLSALTKEPFALWLALPAVLEAQWREAAAFATVTVVFIGTFFLLSLHKYYGLGMDPNVIHEIIRNGTLDFAFFLPAFAVMSDAAIRWRPHIHRIRARETLAFLGAAGAYFAAILSKAYGWTDHLAPVVFALASAIGILASDLLDERRLDRKALALLALCVFVPTLRFPWNIARLQRLHEGRSEFVSAVQATATGPLGTNCAYDFHGWGYLAGRWEDDMGCYSSDETVRECCKRVHLLALFSNCPAFETKSAQVKTLALRALATGHMGPADWTLYRCD